MNAKTTQAFILTLFAMASACANDVTDSGREILLAQCSGTYTCTTPKKSTWKLTLKASGDVCRVDDQIILDPSGKVYNTEERDDQGITWSGTPEAFDLCGQVSCSHCKNDIAAPAAPTNAAGGKCTGRPSSCSSLGAGSCVLDGCSFVAHAGLNFSVTFECEGEARSCDSYRSSGTCVLQTGCRWE